MSKYIVVTDVRWVSQPSATDPSGYEDVSIPTEQEITADGIQLEDKCLKFTTGGKIVWLYAPGSWESVRKID